MKTRKPLNISDFLIIFLFGAAITSPLVISIIEDDRKRSKHEARFLATFPEKPRNFADVQAFPKLFDAYFNDHFGFRNWMINQHNLVKHTLGDSPSKIAIRGKNGWYFLGSPQPGINKFKNPIDTARNARLFSEKQLDLLTRHMLGLKKWLNEQGIKYVFTVAPNKHTIYFDLLPDYIKKIQKKSALDQLVDFLAKHTDITIVDLRKSLFEAKSKHQLYFKYDSHWNHYAANVAQYEIMKTIKKMFPKQIHPKLYSLKNENVGELKLRSFTGLWTSEDIDPQPIFDNQTCTPYTEPESYEARETHTWVCEGKELKALIFRNSFFRALQPYFVRQFHRSTYVWRKIRHQTISEFISLEKPDIVIEQWVERVLPRVSQSQFFRHYFNKTLFDKSEQLLFSGNEGLIFNNHVRVINKNNDDFELLLSGKNPTILLPPLPLQPNHEYILHVQITVLETSNLKIYYSTTDEQQPRFSENRLNIFRLRKGLNNLYISLNEPNLGQHLRITHFSGSSTASIHVLKLKEVKSPF